MRTACAGNSSPDYDRLTATLPPRRAALLQPALLAGLMLGAAYLCVPFLGPLLAGVALLPLLRAWRGDHSPRRLLAASTLAMLVAQGVALGYFFPIEPVATLAVVAVQGAVNTLPWLILAGVGGKNPRRLWLLPGMWLCNDWAWSHLPQIVPTPLGGALGQIPAAIQIFEWTGVGGGTLGLLLLQVWLAEERFPLKRRLGLAAAALCLVAGWGSWVLLRGDETAAPTVEVALIRSGGYQPGGDLLPYLDRLAILTARSARSGADLAAWPEGALPWDILADTDDPLSGMLRDLPRRTGLPLLLGHDEVEGKRLYNTATVLGPNPDDAPQSYRKRWLLPGKEGRYFYGRAKDFAAPGNASRALRFIGRGGELRAIGPLICYEVLVAAAAVTQVHGGAEALLVLANDQEFWHTPARWQLDAQSRVRAVETRRSLLRVATRGELQHIDRYGRMVMRDAGKEPGFAIVRAALHGELGFYVRHPDWLPWLILATHLGILLFASGAALVATLSRISEMPPVNDCPCGPQAKPGQPSPT